MRGAPMELTPFVYFYGRCAEALEFYKKALDGDYEIVMRDGDKIQYAIVTALGEAQWGGKLGALNDRFGNEWYVAAP